MERRKAPRSKRGAAVRASGETLLHRSPSGVSPTRAGEELLPYAERILSLSAQALTETGRALTGHCGVGLLEDLAASQLLQALADLARLHPGTTLEVLSLSTAVMREAYDAGRVQLVLDAVPDLPGPARWTVRRPLVWAIGQGVDVTADPLPVVLFSNPCSWRTPVLDALERADRRWRVAFESNNLIGLLAAVRARLGLTRHPRTEGDPLTDAVETALRRMV